MAKNWFKTLFGVPEKPEGYKGLKPVGPLDTEMGQTLKGTLEERLAGREVGFRPEFLEKATTPYAVQARAGLKEEVLPMISQQASARGLGRSTIPVQRAGMAAQATERDISDYVGKLSVMDEQQRRLEINDALARYQQMTGDVVAGENLKSQFDYADYLFQVGQKEKAEQAMTAAYGKIASVGVAIAAAPFTGGASLATIPSTMSGGSGTMSSYSLSDLQTLQNLLKGGNAARVPISGGIGKTGGMGFTSQYFGNVGGIQ